MDEKRKNGTRLNRHKVVWAETLRLIDEILNGPEGIFAQIEKAGYDMDSIADEYTDRTGEEFGCEYMVGDVVGRLYLKTQGQEGCEKLCKEIGERYGKWMRFAYEPDSRKEDMYEEDEF